MTRFVPVARQPLIPKKVPSREEIAWLGERDPRVADALGHYRAGEVDYEAALRSALWAVCGMVRRKGDVVYLYPEMPMPREWPVRAAIAGFAVGIGAGWLLARMPW